jgi:FkbM family methyltransferase
MNFKQRIARSFRLFGYDLSRYLPDRHPDAQLAQLMKTYGTGLVLDVGANEGQYAMELRYNGYKGEIVSFEPLSTAYSELQKAASLDPHWKVVNAALGSAVHSSTINIAGNSTSSSLLGMLPAHEQAAPTSVYVDTETIQVDTLDRVLPLLDSWIGSVWLKIDTQGYEAEVLKGALNSLGRIECIQLEMSLISLYEGAESFETILSWMLDHKFRLVGLQPEFTDMKSGEMLQVNGIFHAQR